jgi:tetratricopeptide (TPR) repeat protein
MLCFGSASTDKKEHRQEMENIQKTPKDKLMSDTHYQQAVQFFNQKNWKSALLELQRAVNAHPTAETPDIDLLFGGIYQGLNDYRQATVHYEKYLPWGDPSTKNTILKNVALAYMDWATMYKSLFSFAVNIEIQYLTLKLENLRTKRNLSLQEQEEVKQLRHWRGVCYYDAGEIDKAIADFQSIENKKGVSLENIRLGAAYFLMNKKADAEKIWRQIPIDIEKYPLWTSELWRIYAQLGILQDISNALDACQKAAKRLQSQIDKKNVLNAMMRNIAWLYYYAEKYDDALAQIDQLHQLMKETPNENKYRVMPDAKSPLGTWLYDMSSFLLKANIYFQKAIRYYQNTAKDFLPQYRIGECYLRVGEFERAYQMLDGLQSADNIPEDFKLEVLLWISVYWYKTGAEKRAEEIFSQLANSPHPDTRSQLGLTLTRLGIKGEEAISLCKHEDSSLPGLFSKNLGVAYIQNGIHTGNKSQIYKGVSILEKNRLQEYGYRLDKNEPTLLIDLAIGYYYFPMFSEPAEILLQFRDRYPDVDSIFNIIQIISEIYRSSDMVVNLPWVSVWP